jgi:hypothetical protein
MMEASGGFSVRSILRAILAIALLLGSGAADWAPASTPAHESCCCGTPAGAEDSCPCPKPEGNRSPSQPDGLSRIIAASLAASRHAQAERRTEPRPEPALWAETMDVRIDSGATPPARGRDPDLGRHLARLSTFRI